MGHWNSPTTFLHFIWDFILVWALGTYFLLKQLIQTHHKCKETQKRDGQVAIITGGSRGIGLEIVRQLLSHGFHVIIAASSPNKESILGKLKGEFPAGNVEYFQVDISCTKSVRHFADNFIQRKQALHLLINNAGIMFGPYKLSIDGIESQLSTNYIGHFLLTYLLLPRLMESGSETLRSRIVNVSSCCHYAGYLKFDDLNSKEYYSEHGSYAQSKLAQVMQTILLEELLNKKNTFVTVNSVHPGIIDTELYQHTLFHKFPFVSKLFFKSAEQGADGVVHVAISSEIEGVGGKYFENCQVQSPNKLAIDRELQIKLWQKTCEILELKDFDPPL